jgi:hypothetical protein
LQEIQKNKGSHKTNIEGMMKVMKIYLCVVFSTAFLYICLPDPLGMLTEDDSANSGETTIYDEPATETSSISSDVDPEDLDDDAPEFSSEAPITAQSSFEVEGDIEPLTPNGGGSASFGWSDLQFSCKDSYEVDKSPGYIRVFVTAHTSGDPNAKFVSTENLFALPCGGKIDFIHNDLMEGLTYKFKIEFLATDKETVKKTLNGEISVPAPATKNDLTFELKTEA